jgi:hypothetical protein
MVKDIGGVLLLLSLCAVAAAKTGRTYYTEARVAVAKENLAEYEWARNTRDRILKTGDPIRYYIGPTYTSADTFAAQSDEFLWMLQPMTELPRMYDVGKDPTAMCPVHGAAVKKFGTFNPWRIDPIGHPYQVQCPVGGEWYPSNRYDLGDLTSGEFPDDGSGCLYNGQRYHFLAEYAHMVYGSVVVPTLTSLSQAYVLTGDPQYAHKGCILLARLATQYPNYGWQGTSCPDLEDRTGRTYLKGGYHPHYTWKNGGMISDLIWECFLLERIAYAYDGLYDGFDDPEVLAFVKAKGMPVQDGAELREYIEDYILRAGMVGLEKGMIHGNEGHHQACALALALVLDDYSDKHPNSADMVEYAYHGIGGAAYILANGLTRDGGGHESPGYNTIKLDFIRVAKIMEEIRAQHPDEFPTDRYPDIFAEPKAKELFTHFVDMLILDRYLPPVGDSGGLSKPERTQARWRRHSFIGAENLYAFERYGDPKFARALTSMDGDLQPGDLWEPYPEEALRAALDDPASRIERHSRLLDGYGLAILESGEWPRNRAAALNYTSTIGHRQNDQLTLWLWARGLELLPDLGYPRTWEYREQWDAANMAHNTVTVNERPFSSRFFENGCRLFASAGGVHVVTAYHNPYPEGTRLGKDAELPCDLYERTVVMVEVDEDRFYAVDLFAVNGGEQHDQSWHALYVPPEAPNLDWRVQGGTLASPDVAEFAGYTDRWGREYPKGNFPSFLTEIRRAPLDHPATWTWPSGLPEGDAVALHIVPVDGAVEAIMGKGRSPVWVEDKLDYLLVRRQVVNGGASHFLTVIGSYQQTPTVQSVRLLSSDPITLEVTRPDGVDEVTIHLPPGPSRTTQHRALGVRVVMREGDTTARDAQVGALGDAEPGYASGKIVGLDYARQEIAVEGEGLKEEDFAPGRAIRIFNDMRSAMFTITGTKREGDRLRLTLDKPALMAQLPVEAVEKGRLQVALRTPFTTGHVNEAGELTDGANDSYYGAWLGKGPAARQVLGIANTTPVVVHLAEAVDDGKLKAEYEGKVVSVWQYGVGDSVEVARMRVQPR